MNEPDIFDVSTTEDLPDAAIEAALRELNLPAHRPEDVRKYPRNHARPVIVARVIQRHYPERMEDPDLAVVREIVAKHYEADDCPSIASEVRNRGCDCTVPMLIALASYKAGKEAGK